MSASEVIVIGSGKLACGCVQELSASGANISAIEPEVPAISFLKGLCAGSGIGYRQITDGRKLSGLFSAVSTPTLVISAFNQYIFPAEVLANRCLDIVNFHNALLPRHRGRNACTWAIFEMDEAGGITWHRVNRRIDDGDIIAQSQVKIGPLTTALELTESCIDLGISAFKQILPALISGSYHSRPQPKGSDGRRHLSQDMPNNGILDAAWPLEKVSAFLRSLDYGKYKIFRDPKVHLSGREFNISGYRIRESAGRQAERVALSGGVLSLSEGGKCVEVLLN